MTSFLKRAWATLATLPVIATALAAGVTEAAGVIAAQLPAGSAGAVTHAGLAIAAAIGFGAFVVTQVERVAPEFRGFPKAPLSQKEQALKDAADAAEAIKAGYEARIAALEAQLAPLPAVPVPPVAEPVVPAAQ